MLLLNLQVGIIFVHFKFYFCPFWYYFCPPLFFIFVLFRCYFFPCLVLFSSISGINFVHFKYFCCPFQVLFLSRFASYIFLFFAIFSLLTKTTTLTLTITVLKNYLTTTDMLLLYMTYYTIFA